MTTAGYALCAGFSGQLWLLMLGMSLVMTGIIAWMPIFWTLPPKYLAGLAAAAGIALINSIGQLGGIIAPYMVGKVRELSGSATPALWLLTAVSLLAVVLIVWAVPRRLYAAQSESRTH